MLGKPLRLICIGKIKTEYWKKACEEYGKRLSRFRRLDLLELRDSASSLSIEKRCEEEGERILQAINPQDTVIVLDERGKDYTSPQLASFLQEIDLRMHGPATFIIGGPFGLTDKVRAKTRFLLRLSAMTFPHELARVLLLEQLYRAECIRNKVPYHH